MRCSFRSGFSSVAIMSAKANSGLNVYKKVAIIRKADDVLSFEDAEGNVKTITDLHLAAASTVSNTSLHMK